MTDMEERELKAEDIPMGYPLCFNSECADKDKCMHYQARLLMPKDRYSGSAVYPTAWEDGKCQCFREKKLVKKAWGFTKLYDNVPHWQRAEARQCVHALFGGGNGPYYRVHHGQNLLSPQKQEEILKVVAMFGSIEGIEFDQGRRSIIMTRLLANPQYHISGFLVPSTHFSLACQSDLQFAFLEFH